MGSPSKRSFGFAGTLAPAEDELKPIVTQCSSARAHVNSADGSPPPSERGYGDGEVLTAAEVASLLRCSKAHVYKAIRGAVQGVSPLPAIGMGRRLLIRRSTLEQWKEENERYLITD